MLLLAHCQLQRVLYNISAEVFLVLLSPRLRRPGFAAWDTSLSFGMQLSAIYAIVDFTSGFHTPNYGLSI
jgi:hypothetical protein